MTLGHAGSLLCLLLASTAHAGSLPDALTKQRGHRYAVTDFVITQYDPQGQPVAQLWLAGGIRGIAWGSDGLLYAVANPPPPALPSVRALKPDGTLSREYPFDGWIGGNLSHGAIEFDDRRNRFFVSSASGIYRFDVGGGPGVLHSATHAYGLSVAPNGDLYAINDDTLFQLDPTGVERRRISQLTVGGQTPPANAVISLGRGVLHDSWANVTYVSMISNTAPFHQILILDGSGPELLHATTLAYANDFALEFNGQLLVGSRSLAPVWFDPSLQLLGQVSGTAALFVATFPPSALILADSFGD